VQRSAGAFDLGEGTVYPALHRLEAAGLLDSDWADMPGRKRRVYVLTSKGAAALTTEQARWRRFAAGMQAVVGWSA
jgi:DNA-binding PadR family transcriptional regulator